MNGSVKESYLSNRSNKRSRNWGRRSRLNRERGSSNWMRRCSTIRFSPREVSYKHKRMSSTANTTTTFANSSRSYSPSTSKRPSRPSSRNTNSANSNKRDNSKPSKHEYYARMSRNCASKPCSDNRWRISCNSKFHSHRKEKLNRNKTSWDIRIRWEPIRRMWVRGK